MSETIKVRLNFQELVTVSEVVEMKKEDYELYQKTDELVDFEKLIVYEGLVSKYKPDHCQIRDEEIKPESVSITRQS